MAERKPMIVTFKPKDKRKSKVDKQDIARKAIKGDVQFMTTADFGRGPSPTLAAVEPDMLGYDVNRFAAPILMANLTAAEAKALKADPDVATVEEDGHMYALPVGPRAEDDPIVESETIPSGVTQIKAPAGWGASQGLAIKVFILDTGIDADHPDLKANLRSGRSFVTSESSTDDFHGHGTHCAGTVAAAINGQGVVGVAPSAYIHPVKVLSSSGSGNWSWLIAALDWIMDKKGKRIASMSLGGASAPKALEQICQSAYDDGVLLVAAAGNDGPGVPVGAPARYDSVVAVSAIDSNNVIANFSSRGAEVEIAAPGVNVLSTARGGGYTRMSGTSMACPHVSGAAAMGWGAHRTVNNKQVRKLLQITADPLGAEGRDPLYGFGRADAQNAAVWLFGIPEA